MNQKEVNEIRRRLKPDGCGIAHIKGRYVSAGRELISQIDESVGLMTPEEQEMYFSLIRKTLSGSIGKNLISVSFTNAQVIDSEEHRLLMELRDSKLADDNAVDTLLDRVTAALPDGDTNWLILLVADSYDVPFKGSDDDKQDDASDEVFTYILCSVCPVKPGKTELTYSAADRSFRAAAPGSAASGPAMGFMFPSFDDRSSNIYNALCYTKDADDVHEALIDAVFRAPAPMSAGAQKELFHETLADSLEDECSFGVVQTVHEQLRERIAAHKDSKDPQPLELSANDMKDILENSGVSGDKAVSFADKYDQLGEGDSISPQNIVDVKKFEIKTPEVKITVNPEYSYMVETRIISGKKFILIDAGSGVEINGVAVSITDY